MKKIVLSLAMFMAIQSYAQVITNGAPLNRWMGLNPLGGSNAITSVGFGNNFPANAPRSRFHISDFNWPLPSNGLVTAGSLIRTDGNANNFNQWQFFTTAPSGSLNEKFKLFVNANSLDAGLQSTSAQMFFNTATTNPAAPLSQGLPNSPPFRVAERMRLSYGTGGNMAGGFNQSGVTKVLLSHDGFGTNYLPPAVAMLNLGASSPNPSAGSRPWMDIGTYYSMHTDNMYVGLKDGGSNNNTYSVINWGDDPAGTNSNNRLLYLFTGFPGQGQSSTTDGLEVGRMWASANDGRMGIGGDPTVNKYFGNSNDPTNTLEVNAPGAYTAGVVGASGLRFTNLRAASTPQTNPSTNVLSVDNNGDVILVPGGGATATGNNGISVTAGVAQLGVPCTVGGFPNLGGIVASQLTTDRIFANRNQNFWIASLDAETGGVGIGGQPVLPFCGTGNTFEVSANSKNAQYGITGSGMRFTKLTSSSAVIPNGTNGVNSAKVLTVDGDGDVVLTNAAGGAANANNGLSVNGTNVQLGQNVGAAGNPGNLLNNREIPLNNFKIRFNDAITPTGTDNRIELGYIQPAIITNANPKFATCNLSPFPRSTGGYFSTVYNFGGLGSPLITNPYYFGNIGGFYKFGVVSLGVDTVFGGRAIGVSGFGYSKGGGTSSTAVGVSGKVYSNNNTFDCYAIYGISDGNAQNSYGGLFSSRTTNNLSYGVRATSSGATINNYGIYASAPVGPNDWAGYFNANVFINGTGISPSPQLVFSDKNLKKNIVTVAKPMDLILKLRPVTFNMDNSYAPQLNVDNAKAYGLIAQEVANVIPELVKDAVVPAEYDSLGTVTTPSVAVKGVNYTGLIPIAISAIQEINNRQNTMQAQLDKAGLSDAQVKTNINNFNALAKVKTLNPVSYNFTNANVPQLTFNTNLEYGFVAQQLETVYPELVDTVNVPASYDSLGNVVNAAKTLKSVNYKAITALLARSIQEQQSTIDSLRTKLSKQDSINNAVQQQLAALASQINACCSNSAIRSTNNASQTALNQLDVELSDKDAIVLSQNVPNPFAEQTTITYNVPQSVGKAQLLFYNSAGQIIQTVDIKTRGKGKVNVFASDLSSGLYHYTLVADGKVVDSKKMVRE